jgi:hypothetical protein
MQTKHLRDYRLSERGHFEIEQAGMSKQRVRVTEAHVIVFLEDAFGSRTEDFEVRVWFVCPAKPICLALAASSNVPSFTWICPI